MYMTSLVLDLLWELTLIKNIFHYAYYNQHGFMEIPTVFVAIAINVGIGLGQYSPQSPDRPDFPQDFPAGHETISTGQVSLQKKKKKKNNMGKSLSIYIEHSNKQYCTNYYQSHFQAPPSYLLPAILSMENWAGLGNQTSTRHSSNTLIPVVQCIA